MNNETIGNDTRFIVRSYNAIGQMVSCDTFFDRNNATKFSLKRFNEGFSTVTNRIGEVLGSAVQK